LRAILRGLRVALIFTVLAAAAAAQRATADTFEEALAAANQSNPRLNSQRAATPASDEGVGIALSGYRIAGPAGARPTVSPNDTRCTIGKNATAGSDSARPTAAQGRVRRRSDLD